MSNTNYKSKTIMGDSVDDLVRQGIYHIEDTGSRISLSFDDATQSNNVTYVLTDTEKRVHTLRLDRAKRYLARELHAYFIGSLDVKDGLGRAAPLWSRLADSDGRINSNYGYYIFKQQTPENISQLDFVRNAFKRNLNIRKANIVVNGIQHKYRTKDYPCTLALQFHVDEGAMNCDVASRSTDVITGLPYDMAFFATVNELVAGLVSLDTGNDIKVGYTAMHATFTQIYDKQAAKGLVEQVKTGEVIETEQRLPRITDAYSTLDDIYNISGMRKPSTPLINWVKDNM